ncbi:MAG: cupin domain-containing protein [Deltaproteobacteria bacterium]|nr:cupin domain-containing protein [Deltaproteobacteria bacterium]MBW1901171.1 cupin domain-containing protein [Deltaproteobacteria bacterium]
MKTTTLEKLEKIKVTMEGAKDVWKQVPISKDDGSPIFSFRVFTIEPKGHTPYHTHPFEHLNYVISGTGVLVNENGQGQEIKTGDFALILPDEKHQYRNKSAGEPLVVICAVPRDYE